MDVLPTPCDLARRLPASRRPGRALAAVVTVVVLAVQAAVVGPRPAEADPAPPSGLVVAPGLAHEQAGESGTLTLPRAFTPPPNTDFDLRFDGSVPPAARSVITAAAGIWSATLDVDVPIVVAASMRSMAPGYLGAAGPTTAYFGRPDFPRPDVLYPLALANQYAGHDLDPSRADIDLTLSSSVAWDTSTSGTATGQSMLAVALHELGHGLGLTSWVREEGGVLRVRYSIGGVDVALGYDTLVGNALGTLLTEVGLGGLLALLGGPLYWQGPRAVAANGGQPVPLYSPAAFSVGSSVGHLDEGAFGPELMTPFLRTGEAFVSISPITRGMLRDIGWTLEPASPTPPPAPVAPPTPADTARAQAFVRAVATDFLGRDATSAELGHWLPHLLAGRGRDEVTKGYAYSDEWVGVIVDGLYRSTLGRGPDASGRRHWIEVIRSGQTPAQVASYFYASDEYLARAGGTVPAWLDDLYREVLDRAPTAGERSSWVARTHALGRLQVAFEVFQSIESRDRRVTALYRRLLDRAPEPGGRGYWIGVLASGRDVDLAMFLAASDEYLGRAAARFG